MLAWIDADAGLNGERLLANSSELTNWLQLSISGSNAYEAVVFPAPLQPDMMYNFGIKRMVIQPFWWVTPYPNNAKSPLQGSPGNIPANASVISLTVTMSFCFLEVSPMETAVS